MYTKSVLHSARAIALLVSIISVISVGGVFAQNLSGAGPAANLLDEEKRIISIVEKISPTVVAVTSYNAKGEEDGLGSGIIVASDGDILTNNHVITGASKLTVVLPNGKEMTAKSLGGDPLTDLAVIKINSSNLPVAPLGDSDSLKVGQIVIAIGNPYGFERTVTMGVVSALGMQIPVVGSSLSYLIQTDARIYPGNSGGPLVDSAGKVIGVNVAVVGGKAGTLGFAIPINTARDVMADVKQYGRVIVPWIGISYGDVTPQIASVFELPAKKGVLIAQVEKGGPAALAGIQKGDIIVNVEGKTIEDGGDLQRILRNHKVGDKISIGILRNGSSRTLTVTLRERPSNLEAPE